MIKDGKLINYPWGVHTPIPDMKPAWQNAPPWAQWLARDHHNRWFWFEDEPHYEGGHWLRTEGTLCIQHIDISHCEDTLEHRP